VGIVKGEVMRKVKAMNELKKGREVTFSNQACRRGDLTGDFYACKRRHNNYQQKIQGTLVM